jgi:hypothetical protein
MLKLSSAGQQAINDVAQRHGFSFDAVMSMLGSVVNGNGSMAQFSHPEFGGSGQWMQGGMTMIGDMFNNYLKGRVDNLCAELSRLSSTPNNLFETAPAQPDWWGPELRWPNSTGGQNGMRYAWFSQAHRLAIDDHGQVTIYDTLDHQIGGVSQQQSGGSSVTFSSQYGYVNLSQLPVVSVNGVAPPAPLMNAPMASNNTNYSNSNSNSNSNTAAFSAPAPVNTSQAPAVTQASTTLPANKVSGNTSQDDIFSSIEKLASLQSRGFLSEQEFATKKAELLSRI